MSEPLYVLRVKDQLGIWHNIPAIKGEDGKGIETIEIEDDGTLVITDTDGNELTFTEIKDAIDDIVIIDDDEPTSPTNKIWIDSDSQNNVQVPTMEEFNALYEAVFPEETLTDQSVAVFDDGANGINAKYAAFEINPVQNLNGMPYPYPRGGANIIPDGKDTSKGYIQDYYLKEDGTTTSSTSYYVSEYFEVVEGESYRWSGKSNPGAVSICFYTSEKAFISGVKANNGLPKTIAAPAGAVYARATQATNFVQNGFQLEVGTTSTPITPYSNICPISGSTSMEIFNTGKNLVESLQFPAGYDKQIRYYGADGGYPKIKVKLNPGKYTLSFMAKYGNESDAWRIKLWYKEASTGVWVGGTGGWISFPSVTLTSDYVRISKTFTLPVACDELALGCYSSGKYVLMDSDSAMLEIGEPMSDYEPLKNVLTLDWESAAGTIYYATIESAGNGLWKLTNKGKAVDLSTLTWVSASNSRYITESAIDDVKIPADDDTSTAVCAERYKATYINDFLTSGYGIGIDTSGYIVARTEDENTPSGLFVYELDAPEEYFVPGDAVKSFLGQNSLWSHVGNVITVTYRADIAKYIDKITGGLGG